MFFRTDLALEAQESAQDLDGVEMETDKEGDVVVTRLEIVRDEAAQRLGKPLGSYITLEIPPITDDYRDPEQRIALLAQEIAALLPQEGLVLVAGLGNTAITPDNLGPRTAHTVLATRHISGEWARATGLDRLRAVAVLAPGVLGQTGIETGELLFSVVQRLRPAALLVVDALASRRLDRLGCTVQLSNTGISPGSGVGNARPKIDQTTMGVPVVSLGVPTVVDAATIAADLLGGEHAGKAADAVSPRGASMMVTPREVDLLIERASRLLGMAINCALQPEFTLEELSGLVS